LYMYYQNERLANAKQQEIEVMSRDAWKFSTIEKESILLKVTRKFTGRLENKKSQTDNSSCLAC
jgi:hypothetical protein